MGSYLLKTIPPKGEGLYPAPWKSTASYGLSKNYLSKGPLLVGKSISETLEGKTVLIADAATDPRTQYPEAAKQGGIGTILSMPLSVHGN
ncbi:MAG: GAF domain-containing protein, partial [Deltaproteobacteria bacterium]|nr:GAF domain-containing protein [Deltaproteobacteria bacterium]